VRDLIQVLVFLITQVLYLMVEPTGLIFCDPETMDEALLYMSISRARFRLWVVGGEHIEDIKILD